MLELWMNNNRFYSGLTMSESERRILILRSAERLIVHYGIRKTTVSDIAKEAQVAVGSVYLEFQSKDAIVAQIAKERHRIILDSMQAGSEEGTTFEERFQNMMVARLEAILSLAGPGAHAMDLVHCTHSESVARQNAEFEQAQVDVIARFLRSGEPSIYTVDRTQETAKAVMHAFAAFSPPIVYNRQWRSLIDEHTDVVQLVLNGLKPG